MKRQLEGWRPRIYKRAIALSVFAIFLVVFLALMWHLPITKSNPLIPASIRTNIADILPINESESFGTRRNLLSFAPEQRDRLANYRTRLKSANSYLKLITDLLPAAESGDSDAQYVLYKALFYCREEVGGYLRQDGRLLAPDEVIQHGTALHASYNYINLVSKRCFELLNSESLYTFGPDQWLAMATAAGQPAAVAATALRALKDLKSPGTGDGSSREVRDNPWDVLMGQLPTADPDVLAYVAKAQSFLNISPDDQRIGGAAWSVVVVPRQTQQRWLVSIFE